MNTIKKEIIVYHSKKLNIIISQWGSIFDKLQTIKDINARQDRIRHGIYSDYGNGLLKARL